MRRNIDFCRFVFSLLPDAIKTQADFSHRTLVAFNAVTLHDFILGMGLKKRNGGISDEGIVAALVDALLAPLVVSAKKNGLVTATLKESVVCIPSRLSFLV